MESIQKFYAERSKLGMPPLSGTPTKAVRRKYKQIINEMKIRKNTIVLDVGFGQAYLLRFLPECKYRGLDIGTEFVKELKSKGIPAQVGNIEKTNISKNIIDYAICSELIEHLRKPFEALREIRRILKPNGRVIGTTPNAVAISFFMKRFLNMNKPREKITRSHLFLWGQVELRNLLYRCGFKDVKIRTINARIPLSNIFLPEKLFPRIGDSILFNAKK